MRVGLIDVDGHNYPNLALMKLSAYHKAQGGEVEWYMPFGDRYDRVYVSKVFSFTPDYDLVINADEVIRGGTGYCISMVNGREVFDASLNTSLPSHIEHMYPDYSLYPQIQDTAYGYLSRGCPRGCDFCIVKYKEGRQSQRVAHLREFWSGEKNIVIMDPNILACRDREELLEELIASRSWVDINQGLDARLLTEDLCKLLSRLKMKGVHFAWDRYQDKEILLEKLKLFKDYNRKYFSGHHAVVYTIVNYDTTIDEDLDRIYTLLGMGYSPYVMIYNKQGADGKYKNLQRWCNSRQILSKCNNFSDYLKSL